MRVMAMILALAAAAPALADAGDENMTGKRELGMEHCPSAVPGARTRVADTDGGVVVTVTAPGDPLAAAEIRRRVQFQLQIVDQPERSAIEHTGLGTGSGRYGYCPGMIEHTSLDARWRSDGAVLTVRADRPADVPRLRAQTRKRARALAQRHHDVSKR